MGADIIPGTVRTLFLFAEADANDQVKAEETNHKEAWRQERVGRKVQIALPFLSQDFNDMLRAANG